MMIGVLSPRILSFLQTSYPSSTGSMRSRRIRSGLSRHCDRKGRLAVPSRENLVAVGFELRPKGSDGFPVRLDDKDLLGMAISSGQDFIGENQGELTSEVERALDEDPSPMGFDACA